MTYIATGLVERHPPIRAVPSQRGAQPQVHSLKHILRAVILRHRLYRIKYKTRHLFCQAKTLKIGSTSGFLNHQVSPCPLHKEPSPVFSFLMNPHDCVKKDYTNVI